MTTLKLYSHTDIAFELGVTPSSVWGWAAAGLLPEPFAVTGLLGKQQQRLYSHPQMKKITADYEKRKAERYNNGKPIVEKKPRVRKSRAKPVSEWKRQPPIVEKPKPAPKPKPKPEIKRVKSKPKPKIKPIKAADVIVTPPREPVGTYCDCGALVFDMGVHNRLAHRGKTYSG